ncbi:phosphate transport system substrate-binding protein [Nocardiopsis mwathae]|uniref:Phosphate-binding protein n=1 Tax=Nocardiopsis mwathae TaxID=1472723 RepID=A0A7W9YMG8_9ACTN|nr:phosphate transport system substrate-binding protein [Nocardiopsis mwathae]
MKLSKYGKFAGLALAGSLALSACGSDQAVGGGDGSAAADIDCVDGGGTLAGAGSSAQENAMAAWKAAYEGACGDTTVNYDAVGSGAGRSQFIDGAVAFGGSDSALDEDETRQATEQRCNGSEVVNLPAYIAPIAVAFNLDGIDSLNLKPEVIGEIFDQKITEWNDEKIAADNPDVDLPDAKIVPVNRSDKSGTTENFTAYLSEAAGDAWPHEADGDWPIDPVEAGQGSSGVVSAIQAGEGTIGYVDASHVGGLGTAAVGVGDEFVSYSPEAAAAIVDASPEREGNTDNDHAIDLDYLTKEADAYPIVLVAYEVACMEYDDAKDAELVKSFLSYVVSEAGQQAAADETGSAPISSETRDKLQATIDKISAGA